MNRFPAFVAAVLVAVSSNACLAELVLTAEMLPLSGLDGLSSYRITATSDLGNVVGFDFSKVGNYGITGPLNQQEFLGESTVFGKVAVGNNYAAKDSRFLFNSDEILNLFSEESTESLNSAFTLIGDRQLTIGNSVPFVQIATSQAQDVLLKGSLVVRRPNDEYVSQDINVRLSDILIGAAPKVDILPVPPPEPIIIAPPTLPPVDPIPTLPPTVGEPTNPIVSPPLVIKPQPPAIGVPENGQNISDEPPFITIDPPSYILSPIEVFPPLIYFGDYYATYRNDLDFAPPTCVDSSCIATTDDYWPNNDGSRNVFFYDGTIDADGLMFASDAGFHTTSLASGHALTNTVGILPPVFGRQVEIDHMLAEVPEPASVLLLVLISSGANCALRMRRVPGVR